MPRAVGPRPFPPAKAAGAGVAPKAADSGVAPAMAATWIELNPENAGVFDSLNLCH